MARPAQSAVQRIQVGLLGLLTVLLFVSIANDGLNTAPASTATGQQAEPQPKDEPLAELGVTPSVGTETEPKTNQTVTN